MPNPDAKGQVRIPKPHSAQLLFLESRAKRKIIRAGRRGGKTTGAAILAVQEFLKGRRILYAVPVTDQITRFWSEVKNALTQPIEHGIFQKNETEHVIELPGTNQRIRAKTAWNADTLRGDYADVLILDEWQLMDETAWGEVGAPMLLDNNGDAVFIYTPPSLHSHSVSKAQDPRHAAKMFKAAQADRSGRWLAVHFRSADNPHISKEALREIAQDMTSLAYRQETLAEDLDEVPGALWTQALLDRTRVTKAPELQRIIVGIDPSGSSKTEAGIVAAGLGDDGHGYVLRDVSLLAAAPSVWAGAAVRLYRELDADRIVGERNFGGDMVEETVRAVDPNVSYKDVTASRGKLVRAEPICARFEKGKVHHVGEFPQLEYEMCSYVPGEPSPNRMDAAVWALTELFEGGSWVSALAREWKAAQIQPQPAHDPDARFRSQADAGMTQAKSSDPKVARVFGEMVGPAPRAGNVKAPPKPLGTQTCPQCGAGAIARVGVAGPSGNVEERCPCGWTNVLVAHK